MAEQTPAPPAAPADPIVVLVDEEGRSWYVVVCPYCCADLSCSSDGRTVTTAIGPMAEVRHRLRCPECRHPLLPVPPRRAIALPPGVLS